MHFSCDKKTFRLVKNMMHIIIIFRFVKILVKKIFEIFKSFWTLLTVSIYLPFKMPLSILALSHFRSMFPFYIPENVLKTSENQRFSDVFRGYRKGTLAWNGLTLLTLSVLLRMIVQDCFHFFLSPFNTLNASVTLI